MIPLYTHGNPQVRLKAVTVTLAIAPDAARKVLESMRDIHGPQRLYAGMTLRALDDGIFKPFKRGRDMAVRRLDDGSCKPA